jgi:hypothetical protein
VEVCSQSEEALARTLENAAALRTTVRSGARSLPKSDRGSFSLDRPPFLNLGEKCGLDLTTAAGVEQVRAAHKSLSQIAAAAGRKLPENAPDGLLRRLDCAVIQMVHTIRSDRGDQSIDSVKGVFIEGDPIYAASGFHEKTHVQIAVRNPECIKSVFRVPSVQLRSIKP